MLVWLLVLLLLVGLIYVAYRVKITNKMLDVDDTHQKPHYTFKL